MAASAWTQSGMSVAPSIVAMSVTCPPPPPPAPRAQSFNSEHTRACKLGKAYRIADSCSAEVVRKLADEVQRQEAPVRPSTRVHGPAWVWPERLDKVHCPLYPFLFSKTIMYSRTQLLMHISDTNTNP